MYDWDEIDEAAAKEGRAMSKSRGYRTRRPRKPHGVDRQKEGEVEDLLKKLKIIAGKPCP